MITSAAVLRLARRRAGMTQVQLADAAGVTQSVISAYESSRREPSLRMLARLVQATGHDLSLDVVAAARPRRLAGPVGHRLSEQRGRVREVAARHGVRVVRAFGSVVRGDDRDDSDIDLLVDLPEHMGVFAIGRLRTELEELLDAPVDIVPERGLKPDVRASIESDLLLL